MIRYLLAAFLLTAHLQIVTSSDSFLSPPFPPTAFEEQYYEVRFRVRGLSFPTFTYQNLPSFFSGSESGVVSGTPYLSGTFKFTVSYTDGENSGSEEVVISVITSPNTAASEERRKEVVNLIVMTALNTWIYRSGDKIEIKLKSKGGVPPYTWNYKNLPSGLYGNNQGMIKGSVQQEGLYSFSADCGDAYGQQASSFYTLNIQPGTLIRSINIYI